MNSLLLTLTALFILVLSALFAAPLFIDWNDYRPAFEQQATKLLGRAVKVDGQVHLRLLPAPELKFDDVKVADENGGLEEPFLTVKSIQARLNINALFTGTVEAHQLSIVEPTLRLKVNADGTGNWSDVGRRGVAVPFAPKEVLLDAVRVSGGTIEIVRDGVLKFVLNNIDGQASAASLSGPYKVSTDYDYEGRRQNLRFSTGAMDEAGKFRLKAALRDPGHATTYQLDGGVTGLGGRPAFDGTILARITNPQAVASAAPVEEVGEGAQADDAPPEIAEAPQAVDEAPLPQAEPGSPIDTASFIELKGKLRAAPDRAELPDFELTVHAKGRPQILKGSLVLDFGEALKADGRLNARFVDLDALFGAAADGKRPAPAAVLYQFADWVLDEAAGIGEGALVLDIEQAGLGGDVVGGLDLELAAGGGVTIERLKAVLPGDNRINVSGRLRRGTMGPTFAGPVEIEGESLRALTRWAAGDRAMSGQTSVGEYALSAFATIGDGALTLADSLGEVSGTKFRGRLQYKGGTRNVIEVSLDSDRLDLREMLGDGPIWRAWLSAGDDNATGEPAADGSGGSLLSQLRDDDVRATLKVGELLLPKIPSGKLDAQLALVDGTLDIEALDFAAPGAIVLNGKGRIADIAAAPAGRVDLSLQAETTDALRVLTELFGLPEDVNKSKQLAALAPLDISAGLAAGPDDGATKISLELSGQVGGSDMALVARATGEPAKLGEAKIDIAGSVTGERPQGLLVLLFPHLPQDRIAEAAGADGTLSLKLAGVPNVKLTGRAALETAALQLSFDGHGALKDQGVALNGHGAIATKDASLALPFLGLDAPPSAQGVPLSVSADVVKAGGTVDLDAVKADIAGDKIDGRAHFERDGGKTNFDITANADHLSLPALLGVLVAWERTASTEEMLGAVGAGAAEVWPARGFALDVLDDTQGNIAVTAKELTLGAPFTVTGATLNARVDREGLTITALDGALLGGAFAASGVLSPRGGGAALKAQAELKGGNLGAVSQEVAGARLATGPFDMAFAVEGEGLSPPGIVAGLSGKGTLSLGAGTLLALNPGPLRRVAAKAANAKIKATKEEIEADADTVRRTLTKGIYEYAPVQIPFEVKNGTLRLAPTMLAGSGAETEVNGYVELASLKLDSEWRMRLTGKNTEGVPPVTVLFAGPLDQPREISPAVDTAAIESYLTIKRMQEDVERLETLDVTGRSAAEAQAQAAAAAEAAAERAAQEQAEAAAQAEAEAQAAADAKAAAEAAAQAKTGAEQAARERAIAAEAKAAAEAQAAKAAEEAKAAANAKAAAEAAARAKAVAEQAARERAAAEAKAQVEAEARAQAQAEAEAKAKADAQAQAEAQAQAKAKAKAEAEQAAAEKAAAERAAAEARAAAEQAAKEGAAAEAKAAAEAQAAAQAKAAAATAKAAADKAAKERAAAEAKATAERAARQRIEARAAAEKAAAEMAAKQRAAAEALTAAEATAAANARAAASAARAATEANAGAAVPSALRQPPPASAVVPAPQYGPEGEALLVPPAGTAADPIGEMISADPTAAGADPALEGIDPEAAEVAPPAAPPKYRRRRARPDDWKKNYGIFGGG
ncbi:MAG TPA: AsmA family protein [Methyloceanibacter sp.]|nr:AsmA family protein [Methyloceanibacter sp.]